MQIKNKQHKQTTFKNNNKQIRKTSTTQINQKKQTQAMTNNKTHQANSTNKHKRKKKYQKQNNTTPTTKRKRVNKIEHAKQQHRT